MGAIDVGAACTDRATSLGSTRTIIAKENPANDTGKITKVAIYGTGASVLACKVAIFTLVSGNSFTTRDYESIGNIAIGYQEFTVDLDVQAGDYIGMLINSGGGIEYDTSGGEGVWALSGDYIPCTNQDFGAINTGRSASIYGTGATSGGGGISTGTGKLNKLILTRILGGIMGTIVQPSTVAQGTYTCSATGRAVNSLVITLGQIVNISGTNYQWYRIVITKTDATTYTIWFLADRNPFDPTLRVGIQINRYMLQEGSGTVYEYKSVHTGLAIIPYIRFVDQLLPTGTVTVTLPESGTYLGLAITRTLLEDVTPMTPPSSTVITLDDEMMIAPASYVYPDTQADFVAADYTDMISHGMNFFMMHATIGGYPNLESSVCHQNVWYGWTAGGDLLWFPMLYPNTLYRSNFLGLKCFVDEPAAIADGHYPDNCLPADGLTTLASYVYSQAYDNALYNGLHTNLVNRGYALGSMDLTPPEMPIWETATSCCSHELADPPYLGGMITETNAEFSTSNDLISRANSYYSTLNIPVTSENLAHWEPPFLRGACRQYGKTKWGVGIYKWAHQDPDFGLVFLKRGYDQGATYFMFWTYNDSYVLYAEMISMVDAFLTYKAGQPTRNMSNLLQAATVAIVLPTGYDLTTRNGGMFTDNTPAPHLHFPLSRTNGSGKTYKQVLQQAALLAKGFLASSTPYDILDYGASYTGYTTVYEVNEDATVTTINP
jgi:hypothetical protein